MQKITEQMIQDGFGRGKGSLDFSCERIELTLPPGALYEGTFTVFASAAETARGYITSTDSRMECLTKEFYAAQETISYRFHGTGLEVGDEVTGEFHIVSSLGEYAIPFAVCARHPALASSRGEIRNLNQFTDLAKENWAEAVKLFYSPEFVVILKGNDRKYFDTYRAFSEKTLSQRNVEEFLIACGKKQPLSCHISKETLTCENPLGISELKLTVCKEGWGYIGLRILVDGEFAFTEKEYITEDDFLGNRCEIPVYIDSSRLHRGRNFAVVMLSDTLRTFQIPVNVFVGEGHGTLQSGRLGREKLLVELLDCYQRYRLRQIDASVWMKCSGSLVERLVSMDDKDVTARLLQAQLLIAEKRIHEASWVLTHSVQLMEKEGEENSEQMAFYLYLTTFVNRDGEYVRRAVVRVEEIYRRNRSSWRVAWLLLHLLPQYQRDASVRWDFLEKQFHYGCTSPIWYLEAMETLNSNPALLRRLSEYEIQVLHYGARKELLSEDLKEQFLYLASRKREFSPVLLRLLILCYRTKQDERILQEICSQLIKGGRTDETAFGWYELGVEKELRITRLYEYYMMSMDLKKEHEISKKALMYFSWQTNLDYEHTAYLYSYLLHRREEYQEMTEQYRERMEHFVVDQILKEHINRHLAYLYQELLTPAMFSRQLALCLSGLLFAHRITVENSNICSVLVYHQDMEEASRYHLVNGCTQAALYGDKDTVVFEDAEGSRYENGISFTMEKLMDPEPFADIVAMYAAPGQASLLFDRYLWERGRKQKELSQDTVERGLLLLKSPDLSDFIKGRIKMRLLQHFREKDDTGQLAVYLDGISCRVLDKSSRCEVLACLIFSEKYEKAYEWITEFGPYGVEPAALVRLCSRQISCSGCAEDETVTEMAEYVFRQGKYDGEVLEYLVRYFQGLTKELEKLWEAALSFDVDTSRLCERMLLQMMFTGCFSGKRTEIFCCYLAQDARPEVVERYLSGCAYDYLVEGQEQDLLIFRQINRMEKRGEVLHGIEKLAFLKYYAQNGETQWADGDSEGWTDTARNFLREMMKQGIHLNFFRKLKGCGDLLEPLKDKTIVECRETPGTKVTIHYAVSQPDGEMSEYRRAEMSQAPGGIFFREFVLFSGESLLYYFTKERDRQTEVSQKMVIGREEPVKEEEGRFGRINEIIKSGYLEDYETFDRLLTDFYQKEYLGSRLFTMR